MYRNLHDNGPGRTFSTGILLLLATQLAACGQVVGWPDTGPVITDTGDTGGPSDQTPPTVWTTLPLDGASNVALSEPIVAIFDEVMDPASVSLWTVLVWNGTEPIEGIVTQFGDTAVFYPTSELSLDSTYTATVTTGVTDLAGNALAEDYVWTFQTGSDIDSNAPTVIVTNPADQESGVAITSTVTAIFSEAMDPLSLTTTTFGLTGPSGLSVAGSVAYDDFSVTGTFTPDSDLLPDSVYLARITSAVEDEAGNVMEEDYSWTFTTAETAWDLVPVNLGSLTTFVAVSGAGLTNSNSSGTTTLNGDVGLSPTATCLGDGIPCTLTNPVINGTLYANDPDGIADQAKVDLVAAYIDAMSRPPGTLVEDLSGMTLAPGVYTSDSTMSIAVGETVVLDGEGDSNAVWIFQVGSSLTVNDNAQILLVNGASAKNVFWAAFASSTLGADVRFQGSVLAGASNSVGTDSVVVGRLLCTTGEITLLSNDITLPSL